MLFKDLAKEMGIMNSTLSYKINGKSPFLFDEVMEIKEILGVDMPLEELFDKRDEFDD